ncbi:MAG: oligosaccharide flippase family protein [Candidatus Micrarchaeia archaeon]|uniref:oligosaccharide flippase family protein n=1 Tax=Candidatus Hadarchaeum sp. TaxID=2883567 RepID=UPI003CAADBED
MRPIIKDSIVTTVAFFTERSFGFLRELILAAILGPTAMGLRNVIIMLNNYSTYVYLGTNSEAYREVASFHETDLERAVRAQKLLQSWGFIASVVVCIGLIMFTALSHYSLEFKLSLILLAFITPVMINTANMANYLQAIGKFKLSSLVEIIKVVLDLVITVMLAYFYGFVGAVAGLFIVFVVRYFLYRGVYSKYKILFEWDYVIKRWNDFVAMLKRSLRLFITSIANTLYMQIDSLVAVVMLGPAALGIYGVATTLNSLIYGTYGSTVAPVGQRMYKAAGEEHKLKYYLDMLSGISAFLMVFPIAAIVLISPYIINYFIPAFSDAIPVIGVLAVASFFNITLSPISNYVVAKRKELLITVSTVIAGLTNLILDIYLIQLGYGIIGVAYATSFSYFLNFVLLMYLSKALSLKKILEDLIPLVYLIAVLWAWTTDWTLILLLLFTAIYLPIMYYVFYERGIYQYIKSNIKDVYDRFLKMIGYG